MNKGRQRTQKWYLKNESEVMKELGLKPAKGSGNGWIEKEDGENDFVIAQLKSTDKQSYSVKQLDLDKLEYHATVSSKIPMFIIQFLNNDTRYALMAIEDIPLISEYIRTGNIEKMPEAPLLIPESNVPKKVKPKIKSSANAREKFNKEKEKAFEERKWKK